MRTWLLILHLMLIGSVVHGQSTFFNSMPVGKTNIFGMKRLSDGNFIFGFNDQNPCIVKQDSLGAQIWNTTVILNYTYGYIREVEEAADGGIFVMIHASFGPNQCPYIVKLDGNGVLQWTKSYHDQLNDQFIDIQAMPDSGFAVIGGGCSGVNYLLRCRKDGTVRWQNVYADLNSIQWFHFYHFLLTDKGTTFTITGDTQAGNVLMFKCDTAGHHLWHREFPVALTREYPSAICATDDGVAIAFTSVAIYPNGYYSSTGIARFDTAGTLMWMAHYIFPSQCSPAAIVALDNGQLVIGGSINNPLDSMYRRALLMGVDAYGQQQWTQAFSDSVYGDFGPQSVKSIIETAGNEMFVIGDGFYSYFGRFTTSGFGACASGYFGPTTVFDQVTPYPDPMVYTYQPTLNTYIETATASYAIVNSEYQSCANVITGNTSPENSTWQLRTDVFSHNWQIAVPEHLTSQSLVVDIYDMHGKLVNSNLQNASTQLQISYSGLPAGLYCISISSNGESLFREKALVTE